MKPIILGVLALLFNSACTTSKPTFEGMSDMELFAYNNSVSLPNKVYCANEVRVGSHIRKRACRRFLENMPGHIGTLKVPSSSSSYVFAQ